MAKNNTPLEFSEQCAFVEWLELKGLKFTATAHSTYTTSHNQKRRNYYSGLRKGFPDMIIVINSEQSFDGRDLLVFIEMKRTKGGVLSTEQAEWGVSLNRVGSVGAYVCKGCDEAVKIIEGLIK